MSDETKDEAKVSVNIGPQVVGGIADSIWRTMRDGLASQRPAVGMTVLYTNLGDKDGKYPPEARAAIVTKVHGPTSVSLVIFYPTGQFWMAEVEQAISKADGSWLAAGTDEARGRWQFMRIPPQVGT